MAVIGILSGEMELTSPEGNLKIWVSKEGRVTLMGDAPMRDTDWYRDRLRAMHKGVRQGRMPQGCRILMTGQANNRPWAYKMIEAALDVVRQYERPALAYDGPKPNDVLAGVKSPYRVRNG